LLSAIVIDFKHFYIEMTGRSLLSRAGKDETKEEKK
jgi:hypothetical protein